MLERMQAEQTAAGEERREAVKADKKGQQGRLQLFCASSSSWETASEIIYSHIRKVKNKACHRSTAVRRKQRQKAMCGARQAHEPAIGDEQLT